MKISLWLSTFSATKSSAAATTTPPLHHLSSTTSGGSDNTTSSSLSSSLSSHNSLQTNLSLQTLPSLPSLQFQTTTLSLSSPPLSLPSPSPRRRLIASLALRHPFLYAASGHHVHVFDLTTNDHTLISTFNHRDPSSGSVKSIAFHGEKILTAHQDCKIRLWNKEHELVATLPTVKDRLRRLVFPKNYVDVRRHKKRLWIEHHDAVSGLAVISTGGGLICSVSWDKSLKIWRASDFRCVQSVNKAHDDAINAVVVSHDGTIYTASADCLIKVWGIPIGERQYGPIATLQKHKSAVNALALNRDGSVLFSGSCDRSILVWEREDSANYMVVTGALRGHTNAILCLINVSDLLFSGSADRTVRIWRRGHDGKFCCLTVSEAHEKPVRSLAAAVVDDGGGSTVGGGVRVFSGSFDGDIKVWEVVGSKVGGDLHSDGFLKLDM